MIKIYTKKGDQGETCLVSGERVLKSHVRLESYGTLDELNSTIGLAISLISSHDKKEELEKYLKDILFEIQNDLFNLGSQLACLKPQMAEKLPSVHEDHVTHMEKKIDELTELLPPLRHFILPGGGQISATFHIARTICRRSERICIALRNESTIPPITVTYLNRLSDLLFTVARFCNYVEKISEVEWKS